MGDNNIIGISSFCRFWGFGESAYHSVLHFFRSSAFSQNLLLSYWGVFVLSQKVSVKINDRVVLLGDHTYAPKDGGRMPGVVSIHQESETQTKPSYFRGHCWGAIGQLIGSLSAPFCIPISLGLHQGFIHIGQDDKTEENKATLGTRIVRMAIDFAVTHETACVLVLDAFFPCAAVFNLASSVWSVSLRQPMVTIIVRAKKSYAAYFEPEESEVRHAGRPPKYGEKVKIMEMFDQLHLFSKVTCRIYNKAEEVLILSADLLWRPTGSLIRFVFAVTSRGPIVLMCGDLTMNPVAVLELYCLRIRVESMFDMLKNLIGAFRYRFWSKNMPLHSRKPKKNKSLKAPAAESLKSVNLCWESYERFVMLGAISLGLLQLLSLRFSDKIWEQSDAFLRTRSRILPSERTVRYVIANLLITNYRNLAPDAILQKIRERFSRKNSFQTPT